MGDEDILHLTPIRGGFDGLCSSDEENGPVGAGYAHPMTLDPRTPILPKPTWGEGRGARPGGVLAGVALDPHAGLIAAQFQSPGSTSVDHGGGGSSHEATTGAASAAETPAGRYVTAPASPFVWAATAPHASAGVEAEPEPVRACAPPALASEEGAKGHPDLRSREGKLQRRMRSRSAAQRRREGSSRLPEEDEAYSSRPHGRARVGGRQDEVGGTGAHEGEKGGEEALEGVLEALHMLTGELRAALTAGDPFSTPPRSHWPDGARVPRAAGPHAHLHAHLHAPTLLRTPHLAASYRYTHGAGMLSGFPPSPPLLYSTPVGGPRRTLRFATTGGAGRTRVPERAERRVHSSSFAHNGQQYMVSVSLR
mmetsp:Transcript_15591/g.41868  ORF Transcript_15591/g.41868 Transcript_15591/m.41868 type:complete len:367 (+) Transcript_15591:53-1153(+)